MKLLRRSNLGQRRPLKWLTLPAASAVAVVSAAAVALPAGASAAASVSCVVKYTDNFLVNRALPSAGAVCP